MDRKGTKKKELGNKYFLNGTKKGGERVCECVRGCKCVCESERARENERDLDWDGRTTTTTTTVQVFCEECFRTGSGRHRTCTFPESQEQLQSRKIVSGATLQLLLPAAVSLQLCSENVWGKATLLFWCSFPGRGKAQQLQQQHWKTS